MTKIKKCMVLFAILCIQSSVFATSPTASLPVDAVGNGAKTVQARSIDMMQQMDPKLINVGLTIDQMVPELNAQNSLESAVQLGDLQGKKGLVLVFFRSADWCPFCKKHLIEFNQWYPRLQALGYEVAGISYDSVETLNQFATSMNIQFPLLADDDAQTMKNYHVLHADYQPGMKHYGIPYPGIMVIGVDGKLVSQYFYEGYKERVNLEALHARLSTPVASLKAVQP